VALTRSGSTGSLPFVRALALAAPGLEASDANVVRATATFTATSSFTATGTVVRKSRCLLGLRHRISRLPLPAKKMRNNYLT
jgi:hypothetical protein